MGVTEGPVRMERFALRDLSGAYRTCAEVDAGGSRIRQRFHAPDLAGHVYVGPYFMADPALCWVVADELGVAGFIVGTDDAARFERWREEHWYPPLRARHPIGSPRLDGSADDRYLRSIHAEPRPPGAIPDGYPAELHIKLDQRVAGRGWGRQLVNALLTELRDRSVAGIHLGVAAENANAVAFYSRQGFRIVERSGGSLVMVRDLA